MKLRIAHVLSDLAVSSAASAVIHLMRWQAAHTDDVDVDDADNNADNNNNAVESVLCAADGERSSDLVEDGLAHLSFPMKAIANPKKHIDQLVHDLALWQADVLHVHRLNIMPLACLLAERLDLPIIVSVHRMFDRDQAQSLHHSRVAWVQVPSEAFRAHYVNSVGIDRERITVLPYGLDGQRLQEWQRAPRESIEIIGAVGGSDDIEGFEILSKCIASLRKDGRHVKGMYLASAETHARLTRVHKKLGIEGHVSLVCSTPRIGRFLSIMDVLVYPSRDDAMSMVIMKAMACSLPVIAAAEGGIPELLGQNGDGLLLACFDADHLYQALDGLLADPHSALVMGARARATISERYSVEVTASICTELYQHCVRSMSQSSAARSVSTAYKRRTETIASEDSFSKGED